MREVRFGPLSCASLARGDSWRLVGSWLPNTNEREREQESKRGLFIQSKTELIEPSRPSRLVSLCDDPRVPFSRPCFRVS